MHIYLYVCVCTKNASVVVAAALVSLSLLRYHRKLFLLPAEAKRWLQLIGISGGEDNISVMTLHIALNCFIGKMIVLVQFE